jgi:hypothetical protein
VLPRVQLLTPLVDFMFQEGWLLEWSFAAMKTSKLGVYHSLTLCSTAEPPGGTGRNPSPATYILLRDQSLVLPRVQLLTPLVDSMFQEGWLLEWSFAAMKTSKLGVYHSLTLCSTAEPPGGTGRNPSPATYILLRDQPLVLQRVQTPMNVIVPPTQLPDHDPTTNMDKEI